MAAHENVARVEREMNFNWGKANPDLFLQSVVDFSRDYPVTEWIHRVDLSKGYTIKLIAHRRRQPFDSVTDYVMDPTAYLTETGMYL